MIGELNIFGVFVPVVLPYTLVSLCLLAVLRRVLEWCGVYRLLWHRPLVDFSFLVIILAAVSAFLPHWIAP